MEFFGKKYMCNNERVKKVSKLISKIDPSFPFSQLCKIYNCDKFKRNVKVDTEEILSFAEKKIDSSLYLEGQISEGMIKNFSTINEFCPGRVSRSLSTKVDHIATTYPYLFSQEIRETENIKFDFFKDLLVDEVDTIPNQIVENSTRDIPMYFNGQRLLPRLNRELSIVQSVFKEKNSEPLTDAYGEAIKVAEMLQGVANDGTGKNTETLISIKKKRHIAFKHLREMLTSDKFNINFIDKFFKNKENIEMMAKRIEGLVANRVFKAAEFFLESEYRDVIRLRVHTGKKSEATSFIVPKYKLVPSEGEKHILDFDPSVKYINERNKNVMFMGATFDIKHFGSLLQTKFEPSKVEKYDLKHFLKLGKLKKYSNVHKVNSSDVFDLLKEIGELIKILLNRNKIFFVVVGRKKEYNGLRKFNYEGFKFGESGSRVIMLNNQHDALTIQGGINKAKNEDKGLCVVDYMLSPFSRGNEWSSVDYSILTSLPLENISYAKWYYSEVDKIIKSKNSKYSMKVHDHIVRKAMNDYVQYMMRFIGKGNMNTEFITLDNRFFKNIDMLPVWAKPLAMNVDPYNLFKEKLIRSSLNKIIPTKELTSKQLFQLIRNDRHLRQLRETDNLTLDQVKILLTRKNINVTNEELINKVDESTFLTIQNGRIKLGITK